MLMNNGCILWQQLSKKSKREVTGMRCMLRDLTHFKHLLTLQDLDFISKSADLEKTMKFRTQSSEGAPYNDYWMSIHLLQGTSKLCTVMVSKRQIIKWRNQWQDQQTGGEIGVTHSELYSRKNKVHQSVLHAIEQLPELANLDAPRTIEEVAKALDKLPSVKVPSKDCVPADIMWEG